MKNCVGGGKNMTSPTRVSKKSPSDERIIKLLKKKKLKKERINGQENKEDTAEN